MIRNAHLYLAYMYLISYNFVKCIYHGKILLRLAEEAKENGAADKSLKLPALLPVPPSTLYTVHCYIAEALCMLGKFSESIHHLEEAAEISLDNDSHSLVKDFEMKFRKINLPKDQHQQDESCEKLNLRIVNRLNKCVVHLCQGDFDMARRGFDEVICQSAENGGLGLKEITVDTAVSSMLPAYLVNLLTYFYLRTKNLKMARAMIKSRRFVVDQDHICQQVRPPEQSASPAGQNTSPGSTTNKYAKKPTVMMNYKSLAKNFT
jgi:tetratricopeptide (TPR) repeat protein